MTSGDPGSFVRTTPDNPWPIRRSGSFNNIATGGKTVSVGGVRITGSRWARYSPRKPDPDASRSERPGVVKMPTTRASSNENDVLLGLKGAGSRSGGIARLVGTSNARATGDPQGVQRTLMDEPQELPRTTSGPAVSSAA